MRGDSVRTSAPMQSNEHQSSPANRLGAETSPYLLQHAANPVQWWPWCDEAFAAARAQGKPVFLSIGYSTCHWCHVMAHESFEDAATAADLNEHYIAIKVDREERPDVDQIYMQAVTSLSGQGGWPLSVWLDAERKPFWGGTYFPPEPRWGKPSFRDVLEHLRKVWHERKDAVQQNAEKLCGHLRQVESQAPRAVPTVAVDAIAKAVKALDSSFDEKNGGFGGAPKFPRPAGLSLLLHTAARDGTNRRITHMVCRTLDAMSHGGIRDHLGGGFMRYSTDAKWLVPHFEKMLYDNAQLIEVLLDAHLQFGRADFAVVLRDTVAYVLRDLLLPCGAFAAAEDADSEGEEGIFYVFTAAEFDELLGPDALLARRVLGVSEEGNFEGRNILHWPRPLAEAGPAAGLNEQELQARWARWRAILLERRAQRIRPQRDDKVIASWNGMMIAAMARAGAALAEPSWVQQAADAAEFVHAKMRAADGSLLRIWCSGNARFTASLDDRAAMGLAYLALFSATGRAYWLQRARAMTDEIVARHSDEADGALFFAEAAPDLIARPKEAYDGALPSGNSLAALLFVRLGAVCRDEALRQRAAAIAEAFAGFVARAPEAAPSLLCAAREAEEAPRTLTVHGFPSVAHLLRAAGCVLIPVAPTERDALAALGVNVEGRSGEALLCMNGTCQRLE